MTAVTPGSAELLAKRDRLLHAATTMANNDMSKPGTMERHRLIERDEAIRDAAELLERLAAKPDEDGVREATIKECAKCVPTNWCDALLTGPDAPRNLPFSNRDVEQLLRGIQDRIRALSITGEPKP